MFKTKVVLEFFLPTTSLSRINDVVEPIRKGIEGARGQGFFMTYSGPFPDDSEAKTNDRNSSTADGRPDLGRSGDRDAADARARDDFQDDQTGERGGDQPAEPVKRGRGRPPKQRDGAEASGTAPGKSGRGSDAEGSRGPAEGSGGNVARGADEGAGEGLGSGEGRARGAGRDRDAERGNSEEARVKPAPNWDEEGPDANTEEGADWWCKTPGAEWPDHLMPKGTLDKAMLGEILSQHFEQSGDRVKTLAVLKEATGEGALPNVHPDDYDKAARALLKDAARIQYGVKR